jgi:Sulfotransferase domain
MTIMALGEVPRRRARDMSELGAHFGRLFSETDVAESIRSWQPRPTDVVITPFGKCGTTWLQQTFHTLRTRGDMDFDDISRVVPWIETALLLGIDLEAPQRAEPRGFKSHLSFDRLSRGARCVVSLRDPRDALVSHFRFTEGWFFEPGSIGIADYAVSWIDGGYFDHLISWWQQRDNPDVLLTTYEQMSADPEAMVRRLAAFCGLPLDAELLALTLQRSSLVFMLQHKRLFDDAMMRAASEARCGLPEGGDSAKVRHGVVGSHRNELPAAVAEAIEQRWQAVVTPATGLADYAELLADVAAGPRSEGTRGHGIRAVP